TNEAANPRAAAVMITSASFFASPVAVSVTMLRVRRNGIGPPPFSWNASAVRARTVAVRSRRTASFCGVHGMDHLYRHRSLHAILARPHARAGTEAETRPIS